MGHGFYFSEDMDLIIINLLRFPFILSYFIERKTFVVVSTVFFLSDSS